MLALGDTRHGGAGLALAPRAQRYDVPGFKALEGCLLEERKMRIEIARPRIILAGRMILIIRNPIGKLRR